MPMARAEPRASQPIKCESIHIARGARIGDVKVTVTGGARVPVQSTVYCTRVLSVLRVARACTPWPDGHFLSSPVGGAPQKVGSMEVDGWLVCGGSG